MNTVKLIASDMDHTLLTEQGELPPDFDHYIMELDRLGINFAIASGRPLYTLESIFSKLRHKMSFISDNGGIISHRGKIIFKSLLSPESYQSMIRFVEDKTDGIAVLCGLESAFLSENHKMYESDLKAFYSRITFVKNLDQVAAEADKFTVYFSGRDGKEYYEKVFNPQYGKDFSVTIGGAAWIDIMNWGIDKGNALQLLGKQLGLGSEQMMAFGDTYNDIEMLQAVKYSCIVKNAAPDMRQYANFIIDSNDNFGVIKVIDEIIQSHKNL